MKGLPVVLSLVLGMVAACGGGGPDAGKMSSAELSQVCADLCAHEERCREGVYQPCVDDCLIEARWLRGDIASDLTSCLVEVACQDVETCSGVNGEAPALPIHEQYGTSCTMAFDRCALTDAYYCDDEDITAVHTDLMEELLGCLELACGEILSCLDSAAGSQGYAF